jgi:putative membrane protein
MILRKRPHGVFLFFALSGSVLPRILPALGVTFLLAVVVTWLHGSVFTLKITLTPIPFTLIGLALAIFLGFRNSTSYDRYWEGRKLWGQLLTDIRSLSRQMMTYVNQDSAWQQRNLRRLVAFAYALKHHLRDSDPTQEWAAFLQPDDQKSAAAAHNRPEALLRQVSAELAKILREQRSDPMLVTNMENLVSSLSYIQGGCERIKFTPLPFSFTLLLHRTSYLYCFALPFGLVDTIGFMTPFVVAIIAYTFFGLDALGDEIEEPFGVAPNDLPLSALCRTLERDVLATLGETNLPEPLKPVGFQLS